MRCEEVNLLMCFYLFVFECSFLWFILHIRKPLQHQYIQGLTPCQHFKSRTIFYYPQVKQAWKKRQKSQSQCFNVITPPGYTVLINPSIVSTVKLHGNLTLLKFSVVNLISPCSSHQCIVENSYCCTLWTDRCKCSLQVLLLLTETGTDHLRSGAKACRAPEWVAAKLQQTHDNPPSPP